MTARARLVALTTAISFTGCATLFANTNAQMPVATNPPGAVVYLNGQPVGQTPTVIQLEGSQPANIQIYLPGFQPVQMWREKSFSGWFWVNILFWPGFFVDLATGKFKRYDDGGIAVGLTPAQGPPPEFYQQQQQQPYQPPYQPGRQQPPQPYQPPPPPGPAPINPGTTPPPPPPGR